MSYRQSGSGGAPALLLAVFFLAVIGASAGFVLGRREHDARLAEMRVGVTSSSTTSTPPSAPPAPNRPSPTPVASTPPLPSVGGACPPAAQAQAQTHGAKGELTLLMYVQTANAEAWICKDGAGTLYFQGHNGLPGGDLNEGVNALFLTDVQPDENVAGYVASNNVAGKITRYHVNTLNLVIENPDSTEQVLRHVP